MNKEKDQFLLKFEGKKGVILALCETFNVTTLKVDEVKTGTCTSQKEDGKQLAM